MPTSDKLTVPNEYNNAKKYSFFSISCTVSSEKVENVVKPPQSPVVKNKNNLWSKTLIFLLKNDTKPITIAPIIFMKIVLLEAIGRKEKLYLNIAPKAPPKPTYKNLSIKSPIKNFSIDLQESPIQV